MNYHPDLVVPGAMRAMFDVEARSAAVLDGTRPAKPTLEFIDAPRGAKSTTIHQGANFLMWAAQLESTDQSPHYFGGVPTEVCGSRPAYDYAMDCVAKLYAKGRPRQRMGRLAVEIRPSTAPAGADPAQQRYYFRSSLESRGVPPELPDLSQCTVAEYKVGDAHIALALTERGEPQPRRLGVAYALEILKHRQGTSFPNVLGDIQYRMSGEVSRKVLPVAARRPEEMAGALHWLGRVIVGDEPLVQFGETPGGRNSIKTTLLSLNPDLPVQSRYHSTPAPEFFRPLQHRVRDLDILATSPVHESMEELSKKWGAAVDLAAAVHTGERNITTHQEAVHLLDVAYSPGARQLLRHTLSKRAGYTVPVDKDTLCWPARYVMGDEGYWHAINQRRAFGKRQPRLAGGAQNETIVSTNHIRLLNGAPARVQSARNPIVAIMPE